MQEVEAENQTLQRNLEELKISSKRLEQLEQEVRRQKNQKPIKHQWKKKTFQNVERLLLLCVQTCVMSRREWL